MSTITSSRIAGTTSTLPRLYAVRFVFAAVWALLLFTTASRLGPVAAVLLVVYPLFDAAAALVDVRSARGTGRAGGPVAVLYLNIAVSLLAAVGVAVADTSGIPAVLRVWGAWAVVSGLTQLTVGITRRAMGGQWPLIISGTISAVDGVTFFLSASRDDAKLTTLGAYALLGGVFFLVSAIRQRRAAAR